MKNFLFLFCFMFSFLSYSLAKPAYPVKEKQKSKSEKAKSVSQVAILSQNKLIFEGFSFYQKKQFFIFEDCLFACFYGYLETRKFYEKPAKKPCKIPIPLQIRNKDNI